MYKLIYEINDKEKEYTFNSCLYKMEDGYNPDECLDHILYEITGDFDFSRQLAKGLNLGLIGYAEIHTGYGIFIVNFRP